MRVTIKDIANMSGVSVATASMALNDRPGINKDTKKKVLEVANKLHYRPNHSARSLITKKSGCSYSFFLAESVGFERVNPFQSY